MLDELTDLIKPGVTTAYLNEQAEKLIEKLGGKPNFLNYEGFPASICTSVNDEVVHGIPSKDRVLKDGEIVSIDAGILLNGWHSDAARTVGVGDISPECELQKKNKKAGNYLLAFFVCLNFKDTYYQYAKIG